MPSILGLLSQVLHLLTVYVLSSRLTHSLYDIYGLWSMTCSMVSWGGVFAHYVVTWWHAILLSVQQYAVILAELTRLQAHPAES